jgi:hypothetical protein
MENRIVTIARKMVRVQDSCQTEPQVLAAMRYTQLAVAAIVREAGTGQARERKRWVK